MDFSLLPQFGGLVWTLLAFVVALSVIVAIHEYGHYIVGRWCGIHAEVFSIGFGPVIWARPDKRGTVWQIAALPFGGYVKFKGDANAASVGVEGTVQTMTEAERRSTMPGAPLAARAATVAAGPVFNFIMSIAIFAVFVGIAGRATEDPVVGMLKPLPADWSTLQPGDMITAIDGVAVDTMEDVLVTASELAPATNVTYDIIRDGVSRQVEATFPLVSVIDAVQPRSAAVNAGLLKGDVIKSVEGTAIHAFGQLREIVAASGGAPLSLEVWRAGETLDVTLSPRRVDLPLAEGGFETRWLIGISGGLFFEPETETMGPLSAIKYGAEQTWFIVTSSLSALYHIITAQISTCNLSGPVGIAGAAADTAAMGASEFIWFIAVLSTAVGLLNLFPIPVLDGGHLVFYAYEAVRGKPPSDKTLNVMMTVGIMLMGSLMIFALMNDFLCP